MVGPVGDAGALSRQPGQLSVHQVAERLPGDIDIAVAALDEIHRHGQRVVDVALEPHPRLERPRQHPGAIAIRIAPDLRAKREIAVRPSLGERRICEHRGRHRLQRQRDPQLLHHVRFRREIEVRLHRAGAVHHVEAELADLGHVCGHDPVAALGHHRDLGATPVRRHAEPEKADAERARDFLDLREMRHQFRAGLVDRLQRSAGKLELAARLERDRPATGDVEQADDVAVLDDRLPAQQVLHAFQQRTNAAASVVGNRPVTLDRENELLVLRADAELRPRLAARFEPRDQLVAGFDRCHVDLVTRHAGFRPEGAATIHGSCEGGQSARALVRIARRQRARACCRGWSATLHPLAQRRMASLSPPSYRGGAKIGRYTRTKFCPLIISRSP